MALRISSQAIRIGLLAGFALSLHVPAWAVVAHVKSDGGNCTASFAGNMPAACSSTLTTTFTFTPTTTNDGVLFYEICSDTSTATGVTLTASGWTTTEIGSIVGSTTAGWSAVFQAYAPNTTQATFTVTWTGGTSCNNFMADLVDEFSGMDGTNFVDASNSSTATGSGCGMLSVTPVANNDGIWFGCADSVTGTGTYTKGADDLANDWTEWAILSGGAGVPQAAAWTTSGAMTTWGVAIKPAAAATGVPLRLLLGVGK
jgi:hypothetical protein